MISIHRFIAAALRLRKKDKPKRENYFLNDADRGVAYASHAYQPFGISGYATISYELYEQLGVFPWTIIIPVGQGGLLLGMIRGFESLNNAGIVGGIPKFIGVQARACAPLWAAYNYGANGMAMVAENQTVAEGIRIFHPLRGDTLMNLMRKYGGSFAVVDEENIHQGYMELARKGFYVEPTSAVVWDAIIQSVDTFTEPIVAVLTGSGLKSPSLL